MWFGAILSWIALFSASYTDDVKQLVGLQGALYAIGGGERTYLSVPLLDADLFLLHSTALCTRSQLSARMVRRASRHSLRGHICRN